MEDAMDLDVFLIGYRIGAKEPELDRLLRDLTDYLKKEHREFRGSTCGWSHIIKAHSSGRGGSIRFFMLKLGRMLLEQGVWTEEHFTIFTSEGSVPLEAILSLPAPRYTDLGGP